MFSDGICKPGRAAYKKASPVHAWTGKATMEDTVIISNVQGMYAQPGC